ncbi:GNAT family N-acetyltransferase [Fictibacillus phosphorivorans]|uniref:GNAT family N-acetyltransferase n=1 Tax=Fictibacillus phosphorivorans TaxID=1221500 RepID=UPI001293EF4C|nr:GNAT family N-acetyltransferase [Fictibacillus phosphorivorans]MQR94568.1 GNAT family N-acetyltransferase [Fictibacillus phosphorivorans]
MEITWKEVSYINQKNLQEALTLYHDSFPIEVREPESVFLQSLRNAETRLPNQYHFLVGFQDEMLVSLVTAHYLADVNTGFIVYLVTNPKVRSKGLGAQSLQRIEEVLQQDSIAAGYESLDAIVLETETPEMVHTEKEKDDCVKRTNFFMRNGFYKVKDFLYLQPPIHDDGVDVPLHLFIKTIGNQELPLSEVRRIVKAMYLEKYYHGNSIEKEVLNRSYNKMNVEKTSLFY